MKIKIMKVIRIEIIFMFFNSLNKRFKQNKLKKKELIDNCQCRAQRTIKQITKLTKDADFREEEEEIIFNPFNMKNREVSEDFVNDILSEYSLPRKGT